MLQRIQSLYLAVTVLVQVLVSQFTFLNFTQNEVSYTLSTGGITDNSGSIVLSDYKQVFIVVLACIFALVAIALFKNRKLQLKLTKLIGFICLAQLSFVSISAYRLMEEGVTDLNAGVATLLIPLCLVSVFLANKAIKKDENLIKSIDRIR
ncbi:MAG: hypothetical protein ACJA0Q_000376 [Saprospiraceae bacterium]|jgi:hypothetical protein